MSVAQQDVRELVAAAQAGDSAAWHQIFERYRDPVMAFVRGRLRYHQMEADDLASDVWLRALKSLHRYEQRDVDLGAWLITIARNLVADYFKSARCRLTSYTSVYGGGGGGSDPAHDQLMPRAPVEEQPETATIEYLDQRQLWSAVAALEPLQRRCLELRFGCGLSVAETAQEMGKNEGAIKALQYRATRALARGRVPEQVSR